MAENTDIKLTEHREIVLLDMFCKAGGCSVGYYEAAIDQQIKISIVGVDIEHQPHYPFEFIQVDALEFLNKNHKQFTHVHASPPCQFASRVTAPMRSQGKKYVNLIPATRELLYRHNCLGVIENVATSPIRGDIILRGDMFGLKVLRRRKFELVNWFMMQTGIPHVRPGAVVRDGNFIVVAGSGSHGSMNKRGEYIRYKHPEKTVNQTWSKAMGITWMTNDELAEAIPPAYTRYIGNHFFKTKN